MTKLSDSEDSRGELARTELSLADPSSRWNELLEHSVVIALRDRYVNVLAFIAVVGVLIAGAQALSSHGTSNLASATSVQARSTTTLLVGVASSSVNVVVDVEGAVLSPGIFTLRNGQRVNDAIAAAGGLASGADVRVINRAALLHDGDRIYLTRVGETMPAAVGVSGGGDSSGSAPAVVNLNSATVAQLDGLPGVGPSTAQAIVTYRTQHGSFRSVNELTNIAGIGPAKLARIKPLVSV